MKRKLTVFSLALVIAMLLSGCGVQIKSVSPKKDSLELRENESAVIELEYVFSEENVTEEQIAKAIENAHITWESSDENVVTIDNGKVIAKNGGEATITVKGDNELNAIINVHVKEPVAEIIIPESISLQIGGTERANLNASVKPQYAEIADVAYKTSDESIATVTKDGEISAVSKGECVITAYAGEAEAATNVSVSIKATGIGLANEAGWIYKGGYYTIYPYVTPEGAEETAYTFASSNEGVASVSEGGTIYGKSVGTATITVTSTEGYTVTYEMTIKAKPVYNYTSNGSTSGGTTGGGGTGGGSTGGGGSVGGGGGSSTGPGIDLLPGDPTFGGQVGGN